MAHEKFVGASAMKGEQFVPATRAYEWSGNSASLFEKMVGPGSASESIEWSASAGDFIKFVGPGHGAASFVLSSRPIPGRNCLVIQSNFDDLMDALKSTGGATVRFA